MIFEYVFVPTERVFLDGEEEFAGSLVDWFAAWHRANYGGCKGGNADVLLGATALLAEIHGTIKNSIVRDKLTEIVHLVETNFAGAIGSSALGKRLPAGNWLVVANLVEVLGRIHAQGVTILLADQNLKFCRKVCGRGYVLEKGAVRFGGGMEEIWGNEEVIRKYLVV